MADMGAAAVAEAHRSKIEQRAYEIWQGEGCPFGRDLDHWLAAEAEVSAAASEPSGEQGLAGGKTE